MNERTHDPTDIVVNNPSVSGLDWTVFRGTREQVFTSLGRTHADLIAEIHDRAGGNWQRLMERAEGPAGERLDRVIAASRDQLPTESAEIDLLARGAGLPERDLWIFNLRGDLGHDGTGCSDLSTVADDHVLFGHNEDGAGELTGSIQLVTLIIDGDPSCTILWYPGMLPANSFVATSAGLVFGMDHLPVARAELDGVGRHLLARHAQRQVDGAAARGVLSSINCAGGFAFNVVDRDGRRNDLIENAAGRIAAQEGKLVRHTNHLRLLDGLADGLRMPAQSVRESRDRYRSLTAASDQLDRIEQVFAALRDPDVCGRSADRYTFATAAADLTDDLILVQGETEPWHGSLSAFAAGSPQPVS